MKTLLFEELYLKKFNSPLGFLILSLISILCTAFCVYLGYPNSIAALVILLGIIILFISFIKPKYGFFFNLFFAYTSGVPAKFNIDFPLGSITNIFPILIFFTIVIGKLRSGNLKWTNAKSPITLWLLITTIYFCLEILNPNSRSFLGWVQGSREIFSSLLLYFITLELCTSKKFIKDFIIFWLFLSVFVAGYGVYQELFGLTKFELDWVNSDKNRIGLDLINGEYRKFSTMVSPTDFGIAMSLSIIFSSFMFQIHLNFLKKIGIGIGIIIMFLGMSFSGTRTSDFMLPVAMFLFMALNINNRKFILISMVPLTLFILILVLPIYSNYTINRFRSAFVGEKDESYKVRDINRKSIQPYIYQNPLGGGISSTDANGLRFNPGHVLAGFPTDSGLLQIALEQGIIGLFLTMMLYWYTLREGIHNYFYIKDPRLKTYSLAIVVTLYSLIIANFPQHALEAYPNEQLFYIFAACLVKLPELDKLNPPDSLIKI